MRKRILILSFVLLHLVIKVNGQDLKSKRTTILDGFIKAVFIENKEAQVIIKDFMHLSSSKDFSQEKRINIIEHMLDTLKSDKFIKQNLDKRTVVPYDEYAKEKWLFSGNTHDIVIVDIEGKPAIYFSFENDKIASFYLITKGNYGYFIIP